jgi:hypothetical protein
MSEFVRGPGGWDTQPTRPPVITPERWLFVVPRGRMWTPALLSASFFYVHTSSSIVVIPVGVVFAIGCFLSTRDALADHREAGLSGAPGANEIIAARGVAVLLAVGAVLIAMLASLL